MVNYDKAALALALACGNGNVADIFNVEEKKIGVFVDGKPLYSITKIFENIAVATTEAHLNHNIMNVDRIMPNISLSTFYSGDGTLLVPNIPLASNLLSAWKAQISAATRDYVAYELGTGRTGYNLVVTLYYTKTTD